MNIIKKISGSHLVRLTSLNTVSILTRVAGGFLASKMIAVFVGPAGIAITGNLRVLLPSIDIYSTLGMQNGIIKYTAQSENDTEALYRVLATTFISILAAAILCGLCLVVPANYWADWVFNGNREYSWVFRVLGLALPFYTGSLVFTAILSGLNKYKGVIYLTIFGNITGVLFSALLIWQFGVNGALLGLIFSPVILLLLSYYYLIKSVGGYRFLQKKYFDGGLLKKLLSYSLMGFITAFFSPYVYIGLRNMIMDTAGLQEVGFYEGMNRISSFYLMFATTLLTVYFLPQLSKAQNNLQVKAIFRSYYKVVVPLFLAGLILVFVLKDFIIRLTLSKEFLPMGNLFVWQLSGDFFKVCAMILGQEFFARRLTKAFIATELMSFAIMYIAGKMLIPAYAAQGAVMAHCITFFIYFIVLAIYFRKKLF